MEFLNRFWKLYYDGFRNMGQLGRNLWIIITIKLAIMFLVFKLIFFPNHLKHNFNSDADRGNHVIENLTKPANN
ncbi:MAG TPA: DUF4492 domain-containing protein [Salinivirgaceae bacterium]|nr:DUF4492 domain-containing protein [Salinivirgaceae bacterium]